MFNETRVRTALIINTTEIQNKQWWQNQAKAPIYP